MRIGLLVASVLAISGCAVLDIADPARLPNAIEPVASSVPRDRARFLGYWYATLSPGTERQRGVVLAVFRLTDDGTRARVQFQMAACARCDFPDAIVEEWLGRIDGDSLVLGDGDYYRRTLHVPGGGGGATYRLVWQGQETVMPAHRFEPAAQRRSP